MGSWPRAADAIGGESGVQRTEAEVVVGQGDRQRIGGVGRLGACGEPELPLHRRLHLFLGRLSAAGEDPLDARRRIGARQASPLLVVDLGALERIATRTGGKSFLAADRGQLEGIYAQLDAIQAQIDEMAGDKQSAEAKYRRAAQLDPGGLRIALTVADGLREGNYLKQPQVTILLMAVKANQVSVLGLVNKPGRYPLEAGTSKLSEVLAAAGGTVAGSASDTVVISGLRNGKPFRKEIDFPKVFASMGTVDDVIEPTETRTKIIAALEARDTERAERLVREHTLRLRDHVERHVDLPAAD